MIAKDRLNKFRPQVGLPVVTFTAAFFVATFDNRTLWTTLAAILGLDSIHHWLFLGLAWLILVLAFNILFTLVAFRLSLKPLLCLTFLVAAVASYFTDSFGTIIDKTMIYNALETDTHEALELLTWPLARHMSLYGLAPITLLLLTRVRYRPLRREMLTRAAVILGSLALIAGLGYINFKDLVLFGREHRDLRMLVNPVYPISSVQRVIKKEYFVPAKQPLQPLATDASRNDAGRSVFVMVVGETARSQEFSFNGYRRETNPYLSQSAVVNFTDVAACGTSTIESVPCIFSPLEQSAFSRDKARSSENLLDVLQRVGVKVVWLDNNSSSKGVADRVQYKDFLEQKDSELCPDGECYDEILLPALAAEISASDQDLLVVLHINGSHGPSYYKRTPAAFKIFLPECSIDNVQDCSQQEIVNAYDNTIVYTDYILAKVIDLLSAQEVPGAMLYVSDHGESLGENGIYLHGLPYTLAPAEQTSVPMLFWASEKFLAEKKIDLPILNSNRHVSYSHDNIFHSMLGLFGVKTGAYHPDLDLFAATRQRYG